MTEITFEDHLRAIAKSMVNPRSVAPVIEIVQREVQALTQGVISVHPLAISPVVKTQVCPHYFIAWGEIPISQLTLHCTDIVALRNCLDIALTESPGRVMALNDFPFSDFRPTKYAHIYTGPELSKDFKSWGLEYERH